MSRSERVSRKVSAGHAEADVTIRKGRGPTADRRTVKRSRSLGLRKGDGVVRASIGRTVSENYQSVRADGAVELPCGSSPEELKAGLLECKAIAHEFVEETVKEMEREMRGDAPPAQQAAPAPAAASSSRRHRLE